MNKNEELHETDLNGLLYDEEAYEVLNNDTNWDEIEREKAEYLQWLNDNSTSNTHNNDYVTWAFDWLSDKLKKYHDTTSMEMSMYYCKRIAKFLRNLDRNKFTTSQWDVVERKWDAFEKIADCKDKYFN